MQWSNEKRRWGSAPAGLQDSANRPQHLLGARSAQERRRRTTFRLTAVIIAIAIYATSCSKSEEADRGPSDPEVSYSAEDGDFGCPTPSVAGPWSLGQLTLKYGQGFYAGFELGPPLDTWGVEVQCELVPSVIESEFEETIIRADGQAWGVRTVPEDVASNRSRYLLLDSFCCVIVLGDRDAEAGRVNGALSAIGTTDSVAWRDYVADAAARDFVEGDGYFLPRGASATLWSYIPDDRYTIIASLPRLASGGFDLCTQLWISRWESEPPLAVCADDGREVEITELVFDRVSEVKWIDFVYGSIDSASRIRGSRG